MATTSSSTSSSTLILNVVRLLLPISGWCLSLPSEDLSTDIKQEAHGLSSWFQVWLTCCYALLQPILSNSSWSWYGHSQRKPFHASAAYDHGSRSWSRLVRSSRLWSLQLASATIKQASSFLRTVFVNSFICTYLSTYPVRCSFSSTYQYLRLDSTFHCSSSQPYQSCNPSCHAQDLYITVQQTTSFVV